MMILSWYFIVICFYVTVVKTTGFVIPVSKTTTQSRAPASNDAIENPLLRRIVPYQSALLQQQQHQKQQSLHQLHAISPFSNAASSTVLKSAIADSTTAGIDTSALLTYLLQTVISNGVPALFAIVVVGFTAAQFRNSKKKGGFNDLDESALQSPAARLYDDLYGDLDQGKNENNMFTNPFQGPQQNKELPKNTGVPKKEFIKVTNINQKYDTYNYSLQAATQSKAAAAATFRKSTWERTWNKALPALTPATYQKLQKYEKTFLEQGSKVQNQIDLIQTTLKRTAIDEKLHQMGLESIYQLDPPTTVNNNTTSNSTTTIKVTMNVTTTTGRSEALQLLSKLQRKVEQLELEFMQNVISTVGIEHAATVRTILLGQTTGSLLSDCTERPLTVILNGGNTNDNAAIMTKPKLYVLKFPGDTTASQVANLREEVTSIVQNCNPGIDEALVVLQTGGGTVTGYGLAAAQLMRIKNAGMKLTIAVEQVAASGGYMMACIADTIIASPFAVLGSIGVISDIPNVYERLKQEGIEFQTVTAGKYKRTLTPTKKVTKEDYQKTKEDVEEILLLFRDFVAQNRPQLDIEKVATGETWFGTAALEKKLCDEIKTVDEVLMTYVNNGYNVFEVEYKPPPEETPLGKLLAPATTTSDNNGPVGAAIQWLVRRIVSAVREELNSSFDNYKQPPPEQRYMAKDDTADKIRSQY